jgi:hypothetical protein
MNDVLGCRESVGNEHPTNSDMEEISIACSL